MNKFEKMKSKVRLSDIIALIIIAIVIFFIIQYINSGYENRDYLYKDGIRNYGVVVDFSYYKSRKFIRYKYEAIGNEFERSFKIREGDPNIEIGDSIIILYDPKDHSNSTPFRNKHKNVVKYHEISKKALDGFIEELSK